MTLLNIFLEGKKDLALCLYMIQLYLTKFTFDLAMVCSILRWVHIILLIRNKGQTKWANHAMNVFILVSVLTWIGFEVRLCICRNCADDVDKDSYFFVATIAVIAYVSANMLMCIFIAFICYYLNLEF